MHPKIPRYQATKVAGYSAGANCLLGGFWVLKAGVHDRIPSDSCESRFNITALKRPTTVQQCPMILQNTLHRLACLCPTSDTKPNNKSDYETSRLVYSNENTFDAPRHIYQVLGYLGTHNPCTFVASLVHCLIVPHIQEYLEGG